MTKHYIDYVWKEGKPYGIGQADPSTKTSYKVVADPYNKRISVEQYLDRKFVATIYDSGIFDFRHLRSPDIALWEREVIEEGADYLTCLIRNQDDRVILRETTRFEQGLCRECLIYSPHGILVSRHRMHYTHSQDSFDGVVLYDANDHVVMQKQYKTNAETGEFTDLIKEEWS